MDMDETNAGLIGLAWTSTRGRTQGVAEKINRNIGINETF